METSLSWLPLVVTSLVLTSHPAMAAWSTANENLLRESLTGSTAAIPYVKYVRPSETTEIFMGFYLASIDSVDIKSESFAVSGWWAISWTDSRLQWTSASHNDIEVLLYPPDDIWKPAVVISNSQEDLEAIDESTIPARVPSASEVYWRPPALLRLSCEMVTTYFPFDQQLCSIVVLTTGYTVDETRLNFRLTPIMYDFFSPSGEWEIVADSTEKETITDDGLDYGQLTFTFTLNRRSSTFWLSHLIPVLLSAALMSLVFWLPLESGEKMGYSLTNMLAFIVILTIITDEMSQSSTTTSLLEVYIILILLLSALSVFLTIISLWLVNKPGEEPVKPIYLTLCKYANVAMFKDCGSQGSDKVAPRDCTPEPAAGGEGQTDANGYTKREQGEQEAKEPEVMTYPEVANTMDAFFLRFYFLVIGVLTLVFFMTLTFGQGR